MNVIKVSDFGLAEDIYATNYFRGESDRCVRLPVKWMAPESLTDGMFTEKADVVGDNCMQLVFRNSIYITCPNSCEGTHITDTHAHTQPYPHTALVFRKSVYDQCLHYIHTHAYIIFM